MLYNSTEYNAGSYDVTNYMSLLTESITPTDASVTKSISVVKTDSQASADVISDSESLAAFLETVTILQRVSTPFSYNTGMYNQFMYNSRLINDEVLMMATKVLTDGIAVDESLQPFIISKKLLETVSDIDTLLFYSNSSIIDFLFLNDFIRVEISNKALSDTVRVNDWLEFRFRPAADQWHD